MIGANNVEFFYLLLNLNFLPSSINSILSIENDLSTSMKCVRTGAEGKLISSQFTQTFISSGIYQQFSCPYTLEQNGTVERKHRHLFKLSRALFSHSYLSFSYWVQVYQIVV